MFLGAVLVGVHMALTHGVSLAMVASYIPTTSVPGIGRITGTCWSFTDFVFGELTCLLIQDLIGMHLHLRPAIRQGLRIVWADHQRLTGIYMYVGVWVYRGFEANTDVCNEAKTLDVTSDREGIKVLTTFEISQNVHPMLSG